MADYRNGNGSDEKDDFWDVDKLVPKRKGGASSRFISSDPVVEVDLPSPEGGSVSYSKEDKKLNITRSQSGTMEEESYIPEGATLIKRITVKRYIDRYDFYDNFRKAALIYFDYKTPRCDFVEFFSYMPQYSQLNSAQRAYYFYWRDEMRRGRFVKTDYSYVYLYVYEILNLPDRIPPEEGLKLLCRVWREYRSVLPRLDSYFTVWVQDFCLVHRLPCPMDELRDFISDIVSLSDFKEFFLSDATVAGERAVGVMLAYLSDYDWHRGKYAQGDPDVKEGETPGRFSTKEAYREHLEAAMYRLLSVVWGECLANVNSGETRQIKRNAFPYSLCTHMVKRTLEIEYYPISEADGLRKGITAAVRYTENKLRALMGVKSRLAVKDLPDEYKRILDGYFDRLIESDRRERARANAPEYEKLYEAPSEDMSLDGADEIERASWGTTLRLVEEEEKTGDVISVTVSDEPPASFSDAVAETNKEVNGCDSTPDVDTYGLERDRILYLACLAGGELAAFGEAPECALCDSYAEDINEAFADGFGDVILEPATDGYVIIEDYLEEVTEWLRKILM